VDSAIGCCAPVGAANLSAEEADAIARLFKALADPHRVRIVNRIANSDEPVCVCELNDGLGISQPTVSFHLKKLLAAGILEREQRGTWAFYSLTPNAMETLSSVVRTEVPA
jgi:ArsR family transcriptional regulator